MLLSGLKSALTNGHEYALDYQNLFKEMTK